MGSLAFLCHIKYLHINVESHVRLLLGDCLLYITENNTHGHIDLQIDLHRLEIWVKPFGMKFNANKRCKMCRIKKAKKKAKSIHMYSEQLEIWRRYLEHSIICVAGSPCSEDVFREKKTGVGVLDF